jgi:hypothetical protein
MYAIWGSTTRIIIPYAASAWDEQRHARAHSPSDTGSPYAADSCAPRSRAGASGTVRRGTNTCASGPMATA